MAYGIILTVASVMLTIRYALVPAASLTSKIVVVVVEAGSFAAPWIVVATLARLCVSIYVLLYLRWFSVR